MKLEEKTLARNDIYNGKVIKVHVDDVELENGAPAIREVVEHPGGVCAAALTERNEVLFVKQYRYPFHEVCLELPAGKLEPGEDPFEAVQRELREETGCTGTDWAYSGSIYPTSGYSNETIRLWTCRVADETGSLDLDDDEFIEVERIPLDKAAEMVLNNEIPDAKTQILILKMYNSMRRA